ncbi:MAG: NifB/NifX family molybdenum-iron cluster-binding protein [Desulfobacteraceae bacterium]|jgi:predicted Fe-Mo cluster-binding NifX family protein
MKIGISAEGPDLEAEVGRRFGQSGYLIIVDSETGSLEAIQNESEENGRQQGIQMVILAISHKVETVITGYISPTAEKYLGRNGIRVISGFRGSASDALEDFRSDETSSQEQVNGMEKTEKKEFFPAVQKSLKQFAGLLPVMFGVILLIGLFKTFLTRELISGIFTGKTLTDTFLGSCLGSVLAGNPINSYMIGKELLDSGVTFFGVAAFMTAWVSVGLLHLPLEMAALGKRFTLNRNAVTFIFSMLVAFFTAGTFYLIRS